MGDRGCQGLEDSPRHTLAYTQAILISILERLDIPFPICYTVNMTERYDIAPNPTGGWIVIDTRNGNSKVSEHKTHGQALREAIRRG